MNEYFPTVVQVIPLDNFHVQVFFDAGKIVDYDATDAVSYTHLDVYKSQDFT